MPDTPEAPREFVTDPLAYAEAYKAQHGIYPIAGADPEDESNEDTSTSTETDEAPESQDTSTDSTQETATDWEKRYSDLRPEYDRTTQRLSQYEQFYNNLTDPDTQADALKALGLELEDGEVVDSTDDEGDNLEQRIERFEQFIEQQQTQAKEAQVEQLVNQLIGEQLDELDPDEKFSDDYVDLLVNAAPEDEDGVPDLKAAHEQFEREIESRRATWVKSKRAPQAPSGGSPSHQPNLDDPEERQDWMVRQLAESQF